MEQIYADGELSWEVSTLIGLTENSKPALIPVDALPGFDARRWLQLPPKFKNVTVEWIMNCATRILDADLYYPIILTPEGEIADGMHRLAKARWMGMTEINAVRLPDNYRDHAREHRVLPQTTNHGPTDANV
jgi:hypothetical protein